MARLSWRSPRRLRRCRSVRPEDTGTGAVPESMPKAASLRIRPACDQDSRICAADEGAEPGLGGDQARGHVLDDLGDLRLEPGGGLW